MPPKKLPAKPSKGKAKTAASLNGPEGRSVEPSKRSSGNRKKSQRKPSDDAAEAKWAARRRALLPPSDL